MPGIDFTFNANSVAPRQGGGAHPVGNKFPFRVTNVAIKATKAEEGQQPKGGYYEVEFTSPAGSVIHRYNCWNESEQAKKIAWEQLSALCHATGRFEINFRDEGKAMIGAEGLMDVGHQKGHEPSAEKPEGGYVELKKVYDKMGNEPGKAPQSQSGQASGFNAGAGTGVGSGPAVQSGFTPNNGQGAAPSNPAGGGWAGQANNPQQSQPQTNQAAGGWNQQPAGEKAPWQ
jgi:hypothetical protein